MKIYLDMDEILRHRRRYIGQEYDESYLISAVSEEVIRSLPPADVVEASSVVEIVHCKECKFGEWNAVECAYWCQGHFRRPDWYCADAKSKYEDVVK